ncbi:MAG: HEPN domain-containing protein [DPANN group archaeon]|nr:HEPN domain-containing protein [DPANN group archaeon]
MERKQANLRIFRANNSNPAYRHLKIAENLQNIQESGLVPHLKETIPAVTSIVLFGSVATGTDNQESDIDLVIIGKKKAIDCSSYEKKLGKPINHHIFSWAAWKKKQKQDRAFLSGRHHQRYPPRGRTAVGERTMNIETTKDCFEARLLRRIPPDGLKSTRSLEIADNRLKRAKEALDQKFFDFCIMESYTAMFHAARSVLYREGIQEKSHYALYVFLRENHGRTLGRETVNLLNTHRVERHEAMYGLDFRPDKDDAISALEDAQQFVAAVKKMQR